MKKEVLITRESYDSLVNELEYLKGTVRLEIAKNLKVAAEYGDLRENAEFEAEKDRQVVVDSKIKSITDLLNNCKIIKEDEITELITIGSTVLIYDEIYDEEIEYKIVDSIQANPMEGKISYSSPVGEALLNKKSGDVISVNLPHGELKYKIIKVY